MGFHGGALRKRGQHAGNGLLHAAVGRIAAHLGIGIKLEGKKKIRRTGAVRGAKSLSGTLSSCGTAQHTQKPAPDLTAGALRTMGLEMPEQRPEKDGSRIMGNSPPGLDCLGIAEFLGFGNVRTMGGKFRHAFSGVRQGGKTVHTALFHSDIVRAQIAFFIGPYPDAPDSGQQNGFPVQGPPVSENMQIRHLFFIHEPGDPCAPDRGFFPKQTGVRPGPVHHVAAAAVDADDPIPLPGQRPSQPPKKGTVRPLKKEMGVHRPILRRKPRATVASRAQTRPRIWPSGWSRRRQASSARQKFPVCQS